MDIARPTGSEVVSVDFAFLTSNDIKQLSVKQVTSPGVFDRLGHPLSGGLYDLSLGAFLKNLFRLKHAEVDRYVCKLRLLQHGLVLESIELDNISLSSLEDPDDDDMEEDVDEIGRRSSKKKDSGLDLVELQEKRHRFVDEAIERAIAEGRSSKSGVHTASVQEERKNLIREFYKLLLARPKCDNCGMFSPKFRKDGYTKIFETSLNDRQITNNRIKGLERQEMIYETKKSTEEEDDNEPDSIYDGEIQNIPVPKPGKGSSRYILSTEVRNIMRGVFRRENDICKVLFKMRPDSTDPISADMFFLHYLVVPPTRFRLPSQLGDEIHTNPQNDLLAKVLTTTLRIRDLNDQIAHLRDTKQGGEERKLAFNQLMNSFVTIQDDVNAFLDTTKTQSTAGRTPLPGVKQALEKKEGLFRKNMMGKRVNYAARSVISPDPMIETNEIGIPPVFAIKLTYPEPVTDYNFQELRNAVINGPLVWPGATQVQNEDGSIVSLHNMTVEQRTAIANQLQTPSTARAVSGVVNKKVYRHIRNQDVVLMNRQPTLHKASMMGHKVRVLPREKTLRLHYANTGAYNADFDGDEMNMHFPQNETARAEAFLLANTDSQYLTPTSGKPLRGLIQDHISAGVWLTNKDTFFTKEQYQQLIYGSIRPEDGHTTSPRILTVPPAIFKPEQLWTGKQVITTVLLNIKPLDRPGLNLTSKNKIKNEYWGDASEENKVIFKNGELLCGILDKSQYGAADYGFVHSVHEIYGPHTAGKLLSVLGRLFTKYIMSIGFTCGMDDLHLTQEGNKWRQEILEQNYDTGLKAAIEVTNMPEGTKPNDRELLKRLEEILRDDNKLGILDAITQSKVNAITSSVVSKCIPAGTSKRFPQNNMQSMALSGAKGSNVNVSQIMCMLGQQALEGRRVPVMISGKTLPSFKPFESAPRAGGYIGQRFFSGIKPQEYYFHCMAGREGLIDTAVKTSRSGYLQRCLIKQLESVNSTYDNTVRDSDGTIIQFLYGGDSIDVTKESHLQEFEFCVNNYESLLQKHQPRSSVENIDTEEAIGYAKKVRKSLKKHGDIGRYDPALSRYNPAKYLGSVSEEFQDKLETFIDTHKHLFPSKKDRTKSGMTEKKFRSLMQLKYMQSVVNPGEALGIIASQSIGEPSTQMTLNTFHFAGHGAANVTLGIPRMREIIMTASAHIKTPQMTLPLRPDITDGQADAFCKGITKILLSELIDNVVVTERIGVTGDGSSSRSYTVRVQFYSRDEYENEYDVSQNELESVMSNAFLHNLENVVIKEIKKQEKTSSEDIGKAVRNTGELKKKNSSSDQSKDSDDENESDDEDGDEDSAKDSSRSKQSVSYEGPDDEELEVMERAQKTSDDEDDFDSDMDNSSSSSDSDEDMKDKNSVIGKLSAKAHERQQAVIGLHRSVRKFNFDDELGEWCEFELQYPAETKKLLMVNLIEELCRRLVVREIPHIGRCLRSDKSKPLLTTEGVNFQAMWDEDMFIDVDGILSNDVAAVLKTYGVEAARNTIVREINGVFETYAITVNMRHLSLIADMMTREGTYLPFNRQGVDSGTSPFMKMSFETSCKFLTKAVMDGASDTLESPSARIVTGKISKVGTGSFDVFTQLV